MQMVLRVVMDAEGRPVCTEMWPGNTADVTVLDRPFRTAPGTQGERPGD